MAQPPYTNLISFRGEYGRVIPPAAEDRVGAMWSVMLTATFPVANYAIEPQSRNPGGFTDFTVSEWTINQGGQFVRSPFLVVETKRAPAHGALKWDQAKPQLKRYLRGHAQTAATGQTGSAKLYGAIAIGTGVKFYNYNTKKRTIKELHLQGKEYDVSTDATKVIQRLQYIRTHHN